MYRNQGPPRKIQVAENLKHQISEIVLTQLEDPRVAFVTITGVEVSPDLRHAKVYFSLIGSEEEREACHRGLTRARGFIKRELGKRLRMRYMPELTFLHDHSLEHGARIEALLRTLHEEEREREGVSAPDTPPPIRD